MMRTTLAIAAAWLLIPGPGPAAAAGYDVSDSADRITIQTPQLEAAVVKRGYVSGVAAQSFLDKKTGFRDPGFGLDIVDFILEPGGDRPEPKDLDPGLRYVVNDLFHGKRVKRFIEGPQICTQARELKPQIIRGKNFVAVKQQYQYHKAPPDRKTGSVWTQVLVFPEGKRYFLSMDRIDAVNSSDAMFLRIDMPGHLKHNRGDTFSRIYLSYYGTIPSSEFLKDFPPDARFHYLRQEGKIPERIIRGYRLRDPKLGQDGPWLAGMTLDPSIVYEAWCHQRGYVCFIEEFGGRPIRPGQSFSAAFLVGYFDSIDEMNQVYDRYKGHTALEVSPDGWKLVK
jgi:hypothetical protein